MKKILLFSFLAVLAIGTTTSFDTGNCLQEYWGTKKLYQPVDTANVPTPAGYAPVFINYIGRHGARHLTNLDDLLILQKTLKSADSMHQLTTDGIQLQGMVAKLLLVEKQEDCGLLTIEGKEELSGIGRRMGAHYPAIFNNPGADFSIVTTREKRTQQSAASFMQGMGKTVNAGSNMHFIDNDSVQLRFFEVSPGYKAFKKKGNWIAEINKLENDKHIMSEKVQIMSRFFKQGYAAALTTPAKDKKGRNVDADFIDALFNVATLPNAMQAEITAAGYKPAQLDVRSLFTCDEFAALEFVNSAKDFLMKGPGTDTNGIQVRNAVPLLVDFMNTTDSFVQNNRTAFIGRFAHAETICPFATLLDIKGAATPVTDIFTYNKVWDVSTVMGFSANVQWIIYESKDPGKSTLVKILYNERPAQIPVFTDQYPYYRWDDVKQFYINKLNKLDVNINGDMLTYLQQLK